jgi:hypothetical protein
MSKCSNHAVPPDRGPGAASCLPSLQSAPKTTVESHWIRIAIPLLSVRQPNAHVPPCTIAARREALWGWIHYLAPLGALRARLTTTGRRIELKTTIHPIFYGPYRILRNQIAVGIGTHTAIKLLRYHHHRRTRKRRSSSVWRATTASRSRRQPLGQAGHARRFRHGRCR